MEWAVEFGFSVIDYTYLLYFYHMLIDKKWEWKKAIIGILLISILQFCKDEILFFDMWANIVDTIIITGFLFLNSKQYLLDYYFYALLIDNIFSFSITIFVSVAIKMGIDVSQTLVN